MPNIKPISDLRNYSAVLEDVTVGSPVYLTKNGHGCYTIMDINEQEEMSRKARKYDKMVAELEVMKMLNEGLASANEEGWIDEDSMTDHILRKDLKMNKIHYSPKSQRDLDEIYDYIKYKLCSPIAAKNTVSGILDKIENLKSHSDIGNIWYLENDVNSGYRYVHYKNYVVFYMVKNGDVYIVRILHRLQNYVSQLFS